jgi:hypothetical protein
MKKILAFLGSFSLLCQAETLVPQAQAIAEITAAANQLIASLQPEQKAKALFSFDADERENWKFTPQARKGLPMEAMDDAQRALAKKLLASVLSEKGVLKAETIINLEQLLGEMENDPVRRNHQAYFTSIFGLPSTAKTWAYRFEGHHLAVNVTLLDGKKIVAAPTFMGASPAHVKDGRLKGTHPLAAEENLARSLAVSLHSQEKKVVYTDKAPGDILTAENRIAQQLEPVGLTADQFSKEQQEVLISIIAEYAHRHRAAVADAELAKIKALDLAKIRFGWAGSLAVGEAYYYRIQSPDVLIEAANSQNNANHIHTVWRDHKDDFARDSLGEHYKDLDHKH